MQALWLRQLLLLTHSRLWQTGLWLVTWHLALLPQMPGQGSTHLWPMQVVSWLKSELTTHSARDAGGMPWKAGRQEHTHTVDLPVLTVGATRFWVARRPFLFHWFNDEGMHGERVPFVVLVAGADGVVVPD
jgi:hypothetical protein